MTILLRLLITSRKEKGIYIIIGGFEICLYEVVTYIYIDNKNVSLI